MKTPIPTMKMNTLTAALISLCALFWCAGCADQALVTKRDKIQGNLSKAKADVADARRHMGSAAASFDKGNVAAAAVELKLMIDRVTYWEKQLEKANHAIDEDNKARIATRDVVLDATMAQMYPRHADIPTHGTAPVVNAPAVSAAPAMTAPATHVH